MNFNIVLLEPEIPTNTGNIGRLCLGTNCHLHLIEPLGFDLSDKRVKRAGLDYWKHLRYTVHPSWESFLKNQEPKEIVYFSSHGSHPHWAIDFSDNLYMVFGKESVGLPKALLNKNVENTYKIPLLSPKIRSLNLANAVAISIYEGLRQLS